MSLTRGQAGEIAALLNARNELTVAYTAEKVLAHADNYICKFSDSGEVVACVEVKKVQWYQAEILHLTVSDQFPRKGYGKSLLASAESVAEVHGARIVQCTIREGNEASEGLFKQAGFSRVSAFVNKNSGNRVGVYQKVLASAL